MYRVDNEPVIFTRDVDALIVPAGLDVKMRQGQQGYITQALGGSVTVYVEGNLFRIAGKDADALGKEPDEVPELPPNASDDDVRKLVTHAHRRILEAIEAKDADIAEQRAERDVQAYARHLEAALKAASKKP